MLRGLVVLLLLFASSASPQLRGIPLGTDDIRAAQLADAQLATLNESPARGAPAGERPFPAGPPDSPSTQASAGWLPRLAVTEVVVQRRPPRLLSQAWEVAVLDQRPAIRRLRDGAPSLETAPSSA